MLVFRDTICSHARSRPWLTVPCAQLERESNLAKTYASIRKSCRGANSLGLCVSWAQMFYNSCEGNGAEHRKSARFAFEPRDTYTIVLHLQIWYEGMNALADVEFNICQLPLADAFRI